MPEPSGQTWNDRGGPMWGNKKAEPDSPPAAVPAPSKAPETNTTKPISATGGGKVLIQLEDRKLTVGASAKVTADLVAREVVVYGSVKGNLRARDRIEIKKDGSVIGDLTTARIMIEDGAYFKGSIEIDRHAEKESIRASAFAKPAPATAKTI